MRHQKAGTKLNRTGSHRNAMFRNMVTSLFEHGRIHTTDAKAKELRRWADRVITLAKRGDLHARRQALSIVRSKALVHKLFEDVSSRFGQRAGGYTRVVKLGRRLGDGAPLSLVEFVAPEEIKEKKKPKRKKSKKPAAESKPKMVGEKKEAPEDTAAAGKEAAEEEVPAQETEAAAETAEDVKPESSESGGVETAEQEAGGEETEEKTDEKS
jgi:large subunit ribosomal protein L17